MRRTFRLWILGLGSMLIAQLAVAEVLVLRDGTRKEGTVVGRGPNGVALQTADGQIATFPWQQVQNIEGLPPEPAAAAAPPAAAAVTPAAPAGAPPPAAPHSGAGEAGVHVPAPAPAPEVEAEREPPRASRPPRGRAPAAAEEGASGGLAPLLYLAGVLLMVAVCGAWFAQVRKQGDDERKVPAAVPLVAAAVVLLGGVAVGPALFPDYFSPLLTKLGLRSDPTAGARQLMEDLSRVETLADMAELVTDDTAAAMSLPMLFIGGMLALFGGQGVQQEFEAAFADFGLSASTKPEDAMEALRGHGRDLLVRLSGVLEKFQQSMPAGAESSLNMSGSLTKELTPEFLDKLVYTKISDTRVRIDHPEQSAEMSIEARFEDGAWRLHIGNLDEIMGQLQQSMGSMGGMGMPGR